MQNKELANIDHVQYSSSRVYGMIGVCMIFMLLLCVILKRRRNA